MDAFRRKARLLLKPHENHIAVLKVRRNEPSFDWLMDWTTQLMQKPCCARHFHGMPPPSKNPDAPAVKREAEEDWER